MKRLRFRRPMCCSRQCGVVADSVVDRTLCTVVDNYINGDNKLSNFDHYVISNSFDAEGFPHRSEKMEIE